jgi:hypothetical protein|eukprot:COSAG02_NODE_13008_length_1461_cov_1.520558_3_plen_109_part_00
MRLEIWLNQRKQGAAETQPFQVRQGKLHCTQIALVTRSSPANDIVTASHASDTEVGGSSWRERDSANISPVRCHYNIVHIQQRVVRGRWLLLQHVQPSPRNLALRERC